MSTGNICQEQEKNSFKRHSRGQELEYHKIQRWMIMSCGARVTFTGGNVLWIARGTHIRPDI